MPHLHLDNPEPVTLDEFKKRMLEAITVDLEIFTAEVASSNLASSKVPFKAWNLAYAKYHFLRSVQ